MDEHTNEWADRYLLLNQRVGSLLFLWCRLDDALSDALQEKGSEPQRRTRKSFHDRLVKLGSISGADIGNDPLLDTGLPDLVARLDEARRNVI